MANIPRVISRGNVNDEYYTPPEAVKPILDYVDKDTSVWCPFDTEDSEIVKALKEHGCDVWATHIWNDQDFFQIPVPPVDMIISNPPYSRKTDVIQRLMEIDKPFAMLMNCTGIFDNRKRWDLLKYRCEFMFLYPRVNYRTPDGNTKASAFQSAWLCHNFLPDDLYFVNWK